MSLVDRLYAARTTGNRLETAQALGLLREASLKRFTALPNVLNILLDVIDTLEAETSPGDGGAD